MQLKVKELALQGMGARKIANELGIGKTTAGRYLRKLGLTQDNHRNYRLTDKEVINIINTKYSKYEYIGGYTNAHGFLYLTCKDCGNIFRYTSQIVRESRDINVECKCCNESLRLSEQEIKDRKREYQRVYQANKYNERKPIVHVIVCSYCGQEFTTNHKSTKYCSDECREEKRISKANGKKIITIKECKECGDAFKTNNKRVVYCSDECRRKARNNNKDRRLRKCEKVDYSITLTKLYKRDKGICHICGQPVDMDADGNSNRYGSIDHVIAIANGGNHTWDNIKLAHRQCNTLKADNKIFVSDNNQMRIAL